MVNHSPDFASGTDVHGCVTEIGVPRSLRCTQEREGILLFDAQRLLDEHRTDTAWNAESASTFYNPRASELASVALGCHFDQRLFCVAVLAN